MKTKLLSLLLITLLLCSCASQHTKVDLFCLVNDPMILTKNDVDCLSDSTIKQIRNYDEYYLSRCAK